jgi:hypothetical protein
MGDRMTEQELFEEVAKLVDYDPETGVMTWRWREGAPKEWNKRLAGKECGYIHNSGYRLLCYTTADGKEHMIRSHRLAWFIHYGIPPKQDIDHLSRDKQDNRIVNLRDVSNSVNMRNAPMKRNNTSGVTGVSWNKRRGKWLAHAGLNNKAHHLGYFDDISEAEAAVKSFRALHGFTDTHGERT